MRVRLSNISGVALIINAPGGVVYCNQVGGHACVLMEQRGVLVPFNYDSPLAAQGRTTLAALLDVTQGAMYLNEAKAKMMDEVFRSSPETAAARVDRRRLRDSMEAWVYVDLDVHLLRTVTPGEADCRSGVVTWQNSD